MGEAASKGSSLMVDLYIEPAALTCAAGHDLDASLYAIRSGIAALDELPWQDDDNQPITAAAVPDLHVRSAADRARELLTRALAEAVHRIGAVKRTIVVCSEVSTRRLPPSLGNVEMIAGDETTCAHVLARLRSELRRDDAPVLLCAADSLLDQYTLAQASVRGRLRTESNGDGFVPGEAAAAVLVSTTPTPSSSRLAGLGFASEPATILNDLPHQATGMTEAARAALAEAGWNFGDLRVWIADLGGEHYEFNELALAHARLPTERCPGVDLWHPSECVATIGVVAALLGWILATRASGTGWTSTRKIACSSAAANGSRALVLLEGPEACLPRRTTSMSARVHEQVVREHAEEAAFLAEQRRQSNNSPIANPSMLAHIEARLDIHARALAHAGQLGWEIARPAWKSRYPGECFVALRLAFDLRDWSRVDEVLDTLALPDEEDQDAFEQLDACAMALGWLDPERAVEIASWWLTLQDPLRWSLGLAGLLGHGLHPSAALHRGFIHPSAWTRAIAHQGAAMLGLSAPTSGSADACARVRLFAHVAALRELADPARFETLIELATACPDHGDLGCALGFAGLSPRHCDAAVQRILAGPAEHRRFAYVGVVGVGDPLFVPWIIEGLADLSDGLAASYALIALTGLDPDARGVIGGPPATPTDFPLREPDIECAWLDPAATRAWWAEVSGRFPPGRRVMFGVPMPDALHSTLVNGPQRLRALAAWRLGLARSGPIFAYEAPVARQLLWLEQLGAKT